jgi:citrate lyase beta subunit
MANSLFGSGLLDQIESHVAGAASYMEMRYPGDAEIAQPVHTVYTSAVNAGPDIIDVWRAKALDLVAGNRTVLSFLADDAAIDKTVELLSERPVRDLRFDFEDGYRSIGAEIDDARKVGAALSRMGIKGGIRIPGLTAGDWRRSIALLEVVAGAIGSTDGFVFTVPKFRALEQVDAAVAVCDAFEQAHGVALRFELQIESPQAIIAPDGTATIAAAIHRSEGRCEGLHYGTYDYSAACGIAPMFQSLEHPVADHAKVVMQVAAAQTGVWVCDGSTQITPTGNRVEEALRLHFRLVTRSLERGYYQGWDMHPGHLVTRWLANVAFYRAALAVAGPRLHAYIERTDDFDEPASAEALARVVLRGLDCGVLTLDETGFRSRSLLTDVLARRVIDPRGE